MNAVQSLITELISSELRKEASAGFPCLSRIPQTKVIRFLDYFESLGSVARGSLIDAIAATGWNSAETNPPDLEPSQALEALFEATAMPNSQFNGGPRYGRHTSFGKVSKDKPS